MPQLLKVKQLSESDEKRWDNFVINNNESTFYHQFRWKNVISEIYGHKPVYLLCENEFGDLNGVLPLFLIKDLFQRRRLVSIPFAPYGGTCTETKEAKAMILDEAINIGKKLGVDILELRCCNNNHENFSCVNDYSTFKLNLSNGLDHIWKNFEKTVRTAIRKGEKNDLRFELENDSESMIDFYNVYSENMKSLGTPVHDYNFFKKIQNAFPGQVQVAKAIKDDKIISSLLLLKFKDTLIYGWGSSLTEYLNLAPNNFIHWNCIKYASESGLSWYDFGRSFKNSGNYRFKKRWGCIEFPINSCFYPGINAISSPQIEYRKFSMIWSKIPLKLTKVMGPRIRKYVV